MDMIQAIPKYAQLRDLLAARIEQGEYGPHTSLPTQQELMSHYGLSFSTVRRALDELARAGTVYSRPGKGIYVSQPEHAEVNRRFVFALCGVRPDVVRVEPSTGWITGVLRAQHAVNFLLEPVESRGFGEMARRLREGAEKTDGAIIIGLPGKGGIRRAMDEVGFRYVVIDMPERGDAVNGVICDHERAAFEVVGHLIRRGHKRIAFVGQTPGAEEGCAWANAKHAGYIRAITSAGLEVHDEDVMFIDGFQRHESEAYAERAIRTVLRPGTSEATAVFASIESVGVELLRKLEALGVDVPGELAVAGFNDREDVADGRRRLTTVRMPMEEAAKEAVRMLVAQIRGEEPYPRQRVLNGNLMVRASTVRSSGA